MLVMLLNGGSDLPGNVTDLSPRVDAAVGIPAEMVSKTLAGQPGRPVVKTRVPADGFPVWESELTGEGLAAFDARLAELLPDDRARAWFETGSGTSA